ncbi:MAG: FAD-dependent oxidoreductase [Bacteroidota bacterium]
MKTLLILGAGTAGTIMANKLRKELAADAWAITLIDKDEDHLYQPGLLFVPFQVYDAARLFRPRRDFIPDDVNFIVAEVQKVKPEQNQVVLTDGRQLAYDVLIVATGTTPRPEETPGLDGELWYRDAFDFYTFEGACALRDRLATWDGGRMVIFLAESIFKCPIAPLEFAFLADAFFEERGIRDKVEITYVTPLSGAFTKPQAASFLGGLLDDKGINVVPDFYVERVDEARNVLVSYDEKEVPFDLLVAVPVNMGADLVDASGMGDIDDLNYIPTDKQTLQSKDYENVFVIGDATNVPTSKAGSVAHFEAEILTTNVLDYIQGKPLSASYDGHANCFIETGHGKAALIDFNYDTEPLPGTFPLPVVGPMSLLKETRANHMGKLAFEWIYWHMLLTGKPLPVSTAMSMRGKKVYMRETEPA